MGETRSGSTHFVPCSCNVLHGVYCKVICFISKRKQVQVMEPNCLFNMEWPWMKSRSLPALTSKNLSSPVNPSVAEVLRWIPAVDPRLSKCGRWKRPTDKTLMFVIILYNTLHSKCVITSSSICTLGRCGGGGCGGGGGVRVHIYA